MASQAAIELIVSLQGNAAKELDNLAEKGSVLHNALGFVAGGAITAGIGALGGGLTDLFTSSLQESKDAAAGMAQLDAVLTSTGGKAGVTKEMVLGLSQSLSAGGGLSMASDDAVLKGENLLLTFTNIGSDVFPAATQTMVDMAQAMGTDVSGGAIQLGKALNDPVAGISALSRVGVTFTKDQKDMIKSMMDMGDTAGAQKIILGELSAEFGGSAANAAQTFEGKMMTLSEGFNNVKQGIGDALMPILTQLMSFLASPAVMGAIQGVANALVNGIGMAIGIVSGAISALTPVVQGIISFFQGNMGPALIALGGVIAGVVVPAFVGWATTMLTVTLPALATTMAPILAAAAPFIAVGAAVAALWMAFDSNFLGIRDLVTGVWEVIRPVFDAMVGAIGTALATAWTTLSTAASLAWNNVLVPIWNFFTSEAVTGPMGAIATALGTTLKLAWDGLKGAADLAWALLSGIWNFFTSEAVSGPIGTIATALGTALKLAWDGVKGAADLAWNNVLLPIWNFFTSEAVSGPIGTIATAVGTTLGGAWDVLKKAADAAWGILSGIWTFFTTKNTVTEAIGTIATAVGTTLGGAFDVLKKASDTAWGIVSGIWTFFTTKNTVTEAIGTIATAIGSTLGGAFTTLKTVASGVGEFIGKIISTIQGAIDAAKKSLDWLQGNVAGGVSAPLPPYVPPSAPAPPGGIYHKAAGGPVWGDMTYLVGENGPELFTPGVFGNIIPNDSLFAGGHLRSSVGGGGWDPSGSGIGVSAGGGGGATINIGGSGPQGATIDIGNGSAWGGGDMWSRGGGGSAWGRGSGRSGGSLLDDQWNNRNSGGHVITVNVINPPIGMDGNQVGMLIAQTLSEELAFNDRVTHAR